MMKNVEKTELQNRPKMRFFLPKKVFIQLCSTKPSTTQDVVVLVHNSYTSFVNHILLHNTLDKEDNRIILSCHVLAHRIQTCANLNKAAGHKCTIFTIYAEQNKGFPYIMCISLWLSRIKQQ